MILSNMPPYKVLLFISVIISVIAADVDVASAFISFEIVPDAISSAPENPLTIKYASGVEVKYGNELAPTDVKDQPMVTWEADPEDFYTLLFVDVDAPSRTEPSIRSVKHWHVGNIPGNNVTEGETIADFFGSGPPADTDLHRYVFFAFKQPDGQIDFSDERKSPKYILNGRLSFSTNDFAEKYSLQLFGGNFYQSQYDDYVPILHAQLRPE
ncbi:protein D3-like [Phlebotomus argentipes]|uniref:protein D3-like n=1 Tax=Phlebotomus argentipes TaxID=94469 RepID=UPI002892E952|nr:protein D3-like [Phlebotomus argentipes]